MFLKFLLKTAVLDGLAQRLIFGLPGERGVNSDALVRREASWAWPQTRLAGEDSAWMRAAVTAETIMQDGVSMDQRDRDSSPSSRDKSLCPPPASRVQHQNQSEWRNSNCFTALLRHASCIIKCTDFKWDRSVHRCNHHPGRDTGPHRAQRTRLHVLEGPAWGKGLRKRGRVCVLRQSVVSDSLQPHGL